MENNRPMQTTYTSPQTGTQYDVVPKPMWRMAGGFMENCPMYRVDYTQYDIILNGKLVQFCFEEKDIADTVNRYENPGPDLGSRFD